MNWEDSDYDSFENDELDDETDTVSCSHCGRDVYEDAIQCPHCENYLTSDSHIWANKSLPTKLLYKGVAIVLILSFLGIGLQQLFYWFAN